MLVPNDVHIVLPAMYMFSNVIVNIIELLLSIVIFFDITEKMHVKLQYNWASAETKRY